MNLGRSPHIVDAVVCNELLAIRYQNAEGFLLVSGIPRLERPVDDPARRGGTDPTVGPHVAKQREGRVWVTEPHQGNEGDESPLLIGAVI